MSSLPLAVDLDGTLIHGDVTVRSFLLLAKKNPPFALFLLLRFPFDRSGTKARLADRILPDAASLPYRADVLSYVREQRQRGRTVILATAANERIAKSVTAHLGCFDDVIGSDSTTNRSGRNKADALVARFGEKQFVYAGNEMKDFAVWEKAAAAIVVGSASFANIVKKRFPIERAFN